MRYAALGESLRRLDSVETVAEVKPHLRGWLHLASAPLTLAAGIVLIALSPTASTRVGSSVYAASALLLFTVSAIYHRGHWSPRMHGFLRRFDHANIFLLIAGSYTPFAMVLLEGGAAGRSCSASIWSVAVLGVLFKVFWIGAPKWLYMPIYIGMGWAAVFYIPSFAAGSNRLGVGIGTAILVLIAAGGALYTVGGVVYSIKRPEPVAALVRLPRDLPHADDPGVRDPLRRHLDGGLQPAVTGVTPRSGNPEGGRFVPL